MTLYVNTMKEHKKAKAAGVLSKRHLSSIIEKSNNLERHSNTSGKQQLSISNSSIPLP